MGKGVGLLQLGPELLLDLFPIAGIAGDQLADEHLMADIFVVPPGNQHEIVLMVQNLPDISWIKTSHLFKSVFAERQLSSSSSWSTFLSKSGTCVDKLHDHHVLILTSR